MSGNGDAGIEALIARQRPGMTLEQPFYADPALFERDMSRIVSKQWLMVTHESALPARGDFLLYDIAGESIILVRGGDGQIRGFFNVCRHRGSRICRAPSGNTRALTCPYHAWVYDLEGSLASARHMPDDFDRGRYPLHRCQVAILEGLVFVNLAQDDAADVLGFDVITDTLTPFLAPGQIPRTKIAATRTYPTQANWKLVVENFRECYHCVPAHPEFTMVNEYVRFTDTDVHGYDEVVEQWAKRWAGKGHVTGQLDLVAPDSSQPHRAATRPIREGWKTLSEDGSALAPLLGALDEFDGGNTIVVFGPLSYLYLANDHVTTFRFTPVNERLTDVEITWLVREDAVEGRDYDVERLIWLWDVTTIADTRIIDDNQLGVDSRRYVPGPYAPREVGSQAFTRWYLERIA